MNTSTSGSVVASLKQFVSRGTQPRTGERCELCGVRIDEGHGHVAEVENHRLLCSCHACFLLFVSESPRPARYRSVPQRYLRLEPGLVAGPRWDALEIPVGIAFLSFSSALQRMVAYYPGPAGIAESQLPLEGWKEAASRALESTALAPDVEAILVRDVRGDRSAFIVPIDACYSLSGRLRTSWRGFDGGDGARSEIDRFFAEIAAKAGEPV